jgi:hypothetical protein
MRMNNGGIFAQVRAQSTQYDGLENFIGTGQYAEGQDAIFRDFVSKNQYSETTNKDDFATGLIRGMLGGKAVTGKDILSKAKDLGIDPAQLSMKNDRIEGTAANVKALKDILGADGLAALGTDPEDLAEFLKDDGNQQALFEHLGNNGAYGVKSNGDGTGVMSVLNKEQADQGKRELEDLTHEDLLRRMGVADTAGFKRQKNADGEWETDEEYTKRYSKKVVSQAVRMSETADKDGEDGWSQMDELIKKMTNGDVEAAAQYNAMVGGGMLDNRTSKNAVLESTKNQLAHLEKLKKEGKGEAGGEFTDKDQERIANLNDLRDTLMDSDSTNINTGSVNINGTNVTVTGKVE